MKPRVQSGIAHIATILVIVLAGVTILIAVWLSNGLLGADKWPIKWVEVDGEFERVTAEQVRTALARELDRGFFAVDLNQVRETARQVPWVAKAEIRKSWPDTIRVRILEHKPLANWQSDQLINTQGVVFQVPGNAQIQGLPSLIGPEQQLEQMLDMWDEVRAGLRSVTMDIDRIELQQRGSWIIGLNNDIQLYLGREAPLDRLNRFVSMWPALEKEDRGIPSYVDMRFSNGFAVQWPARSFNDPRSES